jgi:hypothetical protein
LGYAPPRARQASTARAGALDTAAFDAAALDIKALDPNGLDPKGADAKGLGSPSDSQGKAPRIATSLRDDPNSASNASREATPSRNVTSLRDALSPRDGTGSREGGKSLRDALSPRDGAASRGGGKSLRDAISQRDGVSPHDGLVQREPSALRDTPPPRDNLASLDVTSARSPMPPREGLAPRDLPSRDAAPLRSPAPPREGAVPRDLPSRDARPPAPPREGLSPRETISRDSLRPSALPRTGLASRENPPPEAPLMRPAVAPREGLGLRDTLSSRDPLSARPSAPVRDPFTLLDVTSVRETGLKGDLISNAGPRTLLDEAVDLDMAPSTDAGSRREPPNLEGPAAAPRPAPGGETPWKRKRRSPGVFEGDAALKELRTRLAAAPTDQAPEPPLAPPKTPMLASAVRLMGVVGLAATGALGFLWLTSHGSRHDPEVTLVDNTQPAAQPGRFDGSASTLRTVEVPAATEQSLAIATNYTNDAADKMLKPPVVPQPHTAGPPRPPTMPPVAAARPAPPPPPVAAPSPPPVPAPAPVAVAPAVVAPVAVTPPPTPAPVAVAAPAAAPRLDRDEVNAMLARARTFLSSGDVAAARVVLRRAAASDDPQAALALGGTYDPIVLKKLGIIFHADPAQARDWYLKAAALGSVDASARLQQLAQ